MNRQEHLQWAKDRAFAETGKSSSVAGWMGFKHDMQKHDEIRNDPTMQFLFERGDDICRDAVRPMLSGLGVRVRPLEQKLRRFIEDFN